MKHSSDGDPLSSANVADDDRCPALALPSASTKTHERAYSFSGFPGERTGGPAATGGRDVGVDASSGNVLSDGGRRTDMDDVVSVCLSARMPVWLHIVIQTDEAVLLDPGAPGWTVLSCCSTHSGKYIHLQFPLHTTPAHSEREYHRLELRPFSVVHSSSHSPTPPILR